MSRICWTGKGRWRGDDRASLVNVLRVAEKIGIPVQAGRPCRD